MTRKTKLGLQFIALFATLGLGAFGVVRSGANIGLVFAVLGLMSCSIAGLALGEARTVAEAAQDQAASENRARDNQLDAVFSYVARLIQSHLDVSSRYSKSLEDANHELPALDNPEQVRSVVVMLVDENQKVQRRMNDLSKNLEESRQQIVQLRSNLAEAKEMGLRDPLTSLGNRRCFDSSLARKMIEAEGEGEDLCLAIGDLDNFKRINDQFGHAIGDLVLKSFSEVLTENTKGRGIVARLGGEEFAIVFPRTRLADAVKVTDHIRSKLESKRWVLDGSGRKIGTVTVSFGVSQLRQGESAEDLFRRADAKLYEAKAQGRNRVAGAQEVKSKSAA